MKRVYICSPLRGNIEENRAHAEQYCRYAANNGYIPYAPHVYFTRFLDDNKQDERIMGINEGLHWLSACNEIWVFGDEISEGMRSEIEYAKSSNMPIRYF